MKRWWALIAAVAVAAGGVALWYALAHGKGDARATPPSAPVSFGLQGAVLSIDREPSAAVRASLLVKGTALGDSGVDYASLRVTSETQILRQRGNATVRGDPGDLAVGQTVKVALVGPVAESYPVQGMASVIMILD